MAQENSLKRKSPTVWEIISQLCQESIFIKVDFLIEEKSKLDITSSFQSRVTSDINDKLFQILSLLKSERPTDSKDTKTQSIIQKSNCWSHLILLISEQSNENKPWSSPDNAQLVSAIEFEIIRVQFEKPNVQPKTKSYNSCNQSVIQDLLQSDFSNTSPQKSIVGQILKFFREKFKKDDWKYYPASIVAFQQILYNLHYPHLSDHMEQILPLILLFMEDYYDDNKLLGLQCLKHAIENLNKSDLMINNWAGVLHSTILRSTAEKNSTIVSEIGPALINLSKVIENRHRACTEMSTYDETLKQVIFTMEFCSDIKLKNVWMPYLIEILDIMGHSTVHWVDKISQMLIDFTSCNDHETWMWILKTTRTCVQNTWLKPKSDIFAEIILRVIFNASVFAVDFCTQANQLELYSLAKECFLLLQNCDDYVSTHLDIMEILNSDIATNSKLHPKFIHAIKNFVFHNEVR